MEEKKLEGKAQLKNENTFAIKENKTADEKKNNEELVNEKIEKQIANLAKENEELRKELEELKREKCGENLEGDNALISKKASELYDEAKKSGKVFITLHDKDRNYWNSGDELHFFIQQGRCKELPEEEDLTEVIKHALSPGNQLLIEATDLELKEEMKVRAREKLISSGKIKASKKPEDEKRIKW